MKSGQEIFIRAYDKSISADKLELEVQVAGSMEISSARINYIVFSPGSAVFASYGGGVSETNFVQSKVYNLQKFIHSSPYGFYGLANIRLSTPGASAISADLSNDFYLRLDSLRSFNELYLSYIIIGVTPSACCSACSNRIVAQSDCVAACPANTYAVTFKDGAQGCRTCPDQYNFEVNSAGTGCTCRSGFAEQNGICIAQPGVTASKRN